MRSWAIVRPLDQKAILTAALEGFELQLQRLEAQIRQLRAQLGRHANTSQAVNSSPATPKRARQLSPEARQRIAAAQLKRWARYRKEQKAQAAE